MWSRSTAASVRMYVECLIGKQNKPTLFKVTEPSSVPYRTPSAFTKWAAYPDLKFVCACTVYVRRFGVIVSVAHAFCPLKWTHLFVLCSLGVSEHVTTSKTQRRIHASDCLSGWRSYWMYPARSYRLGWMNGWSFLRKCVHYIQWLLCFCCWQGLVNCSMRIQDLYVESFPRFIRNNHRDYSLRLLGGMYIIRERCVFLSSWLG
jgi:hypothetical protein